MTQQDQHLLERTMKTLADAMALIKKQSDAMNAMCDDMHLAVDFGKKMRDERDIFLSHLKAICTAHAAVESGFNSENTVDNVRMRFVRLDNMEKSIQAARSSLKDMGCST